MDEREANLALTIYGDGEATTARYGQFKDNQGGFALTEAATWTSRHAFKVISDPAPPGLLGPVTLRAETKVEISWPFGDIEKRPLSENL